MRIKGISTRQFEQLLNECCGKPIWKIIHPADGIIHISVGTKLLDNFHDRLVGEHTLFIYGDWIFCQQGQEISTSALLPGENRSEYIRRMESFVERLSVVDHVKNIRIQEKGHLVVIAFDTGDQIQVVENEYGWVSITNNLSLSQDGTVTGARHARRDERTGKLVYIQSS